MRIITTVALIICCCSASYGFTNFNRFMLKLKEFEYPQYTISDPSLNFYLSTNGSENEGVNGAEYSGFNVRGNAEGAYKFTTIRPQYWLDVNTTLAITGFYDQSENNGQRDTTKAIIGSSTLHTQYEFHPLAELLDNIAFAGITVDNSYIRNWNKNTNYESTYDYDDLTGKAEIGASFRKPIKPLYIALEMERRLKDAGVISDTLTSGTLQELSKIMVSREKLKLRHEKAQKYIMQQIDSVLVKDSLVDKSKLDAFALFEISEAQDAYFEEIYTGFRISLGIAGVGKWKPSAYYNPQTDHRRTDDFYKAVMELSLSYTVPVYTRLFFYTELRKKETRKFDGFEHNFKYQIVNTGVHYFLTNRIIASYKVDGISCKYFFPENKSINNMTIDLDYYLEDKVNLNFYGSRDFGGLDYRSRIFSVGMWLRFGLM